MDRLQLQAGGGGKEPGTLSSPSLQAETDRKINLSAQPDRILCLDPQPHAANNRHPPLRDPQPIPPEGGAGGAPPRMLLCQVTNSWLLPWQTETRSRTAATEIAAQECLWGRC